MGGGGRAALLSSNGGLSSPPRVLRVVSEELGEFMEMKGASSPGILVLTTGLSKPFMRLDKYPALLKELERHMEVPPARPAPPTPAPRPTHACAPPRPRLRPAHACAPPATPGRGLPGQILQRGLRSGP